METDENASISSSKPDDKNSKSMNESKNSDRCQDSEDINASISPSKPDGEHSEGKQNANENDANENSDGSQRVADGTEESDNNNSSAAPVTDGRQSGLSLNDMSDSVNPTTAKNEDGLDGQDTHSQVRMLPILTFEACVKL